MRSMFCARLRLVTAVSLTCAVVAAPAASAPERGAAQLSFERNGSIFVASPDARNTAVYLRARPGRQWSYSYSEPAWSPDGTGLAVVESEYPGPANDEGHGFSWLSIYRSGKPPFRPDCDCGNGWGDSPSWSPDGLRVVFVAYWQFEPYWSGPLRTANLVNETAHYLTWWKRRDGPPAWSPDGKLIAFGRTEYTCGRDPNNVVCRRLYVIAPRGGKVRPLTNVDATNPSWSPDGKQIAFDNGRRIGIVGRGGGAIRFIANGTDPAWSPDGERIAFVKNRNVWLIDPSGRRPRLAVRNASAPAWRPSA